MISGKDCTRGHTKAKRKRETQNGCLPKEASQKPHWSRRRRTADFVSLCCTFSVRPYARPSSRETFYFSCLFSYLARRQPTHEKPWLSGIAPIPLAWGTPASLQVLHSRLRSATSVRFVYGCLFILGALRYVSAVMLVVWCAEESRQPTCNERLSSESSENLVDFAIRHWELTNEKQKWLGALGASSSNFKTKLHCICLWKGDK